MQRKFNLSIDPVGAPTKILQETLKKFLNELKNLLLINTSVGNNSHIGL